MAVGCVVIAAFVEAAQQALIGAPKVSAALPAFVTNPNVNYGPLGLLIFAGLLWVIKQFQRKQVPSTKVVNSAENEEISADSPLVFRKGMLAWRNSRTRQVANKEFVNQEVPLDGIEYIDCKFDRVTFVYNGLAPSGISGLSGVTYDEKGRPTARCKSTNPIVNNAGLIF